MSTSMVIFKPLYPPEGGKPLAFSCTFCHKPTRTERGIRSHVWKKHGIREQIELPFIKEQGPNK